MTRLEYVPEPAAAARPNIVVDGSPNAGTVLTLTHWPGYPPPRGLEADLSAQMAFKLLGRPDLIPAGVTAVTNNHLDQDGLASIFTLTRPDLARQHEMLLVDLAAAGDFATYRDRWAARLSMIVSTYVDPQRSPLAPLPSDYPELAGLLYGELLDRLPELLQHRDRDRHLWVDEDAALSASITAIEDGSVAIREHPDVDLVCVDLPPNLDGWSGHRFAGNSFEGIHPMALHAVSDCFVVLLTHGRHFRLNHRYETWVQYQSRRPRPRVDLAPLAEELTALEPGSVQWHADPVDALTPMMRPLGDGSDLASEIVETTVARHLRTAAPAFDPYRPKP